MRKLALMGLAAFLLFATAGATADTFSLTVVSQTSSTITFSYPQQPGYGYLYSANGAVVSRTNDPARTQIRFSKANSYEVAAIVKGTTGSYPTGPPPPPKAQCADGLDNDSDGKIDYPADPGCSSATDNDETNAVQPPPGNVVTVTGTVTGSVFVSMINAAAAGPVTVEPGEGQPSFTVTGDWQLGRANVTIQNMVATGTDVRFQPSADNLTVQDSKMRMFYVADGGLNNLLLQRNTFDAECLVAQNWMYGATNFRILNNTFKNYHYCANEDAHSEGIFVAAHNNGGLIQGNTFTDNGTTGHLFFSWWGASNDANSPHTEYPRNICVTGNTFIRSLNGYYHIQFRNEFDGSENVDIDPSNVKGASIPGYNTSLSTGFVRPC